MKIVLLKRKTKRYDKKEKKGKRIRKDERGLGVIDRIIFIPHHPTPIDDPSIVPGIAVALFLAQTVLCTNDIYLPRCCANDYLLTF